jgi:hypothetical protein
MRPLALVVMTILVGTARDARADVAPEPDSLDAHCSLEEQCPGGTFCSYSNHPDTPLEETEKNQSCSAGAEAKGLERRCTDGGGTVGRHLYCPRGETGSWSPGCSRCSMGVASLPRLPLLTVAGAAALALARRRGQRRRGTPRGRRR